MATAIKTLVKNIRKKFDRRFQNVFFSIICYTQATKEKTNSVGKLGTWWWSRRTWANLFWWKHKITTNCWSTIDKKLKKKNWRLSKKISYIQRQRRNHKEMVKVKVTQGCLILCDFMDYTVCGILQSRILEWVAIPFSRGSSQPRDQTQFSHIAGIFFTSRATREAQGDGRRGEITIKSNPISTGWVNPKLENNDVTEVLP